MKKMSFIVGSITILPDSLYIEQRGLFSPKKTTTIPFSDIKDVSGMFDRLHIETSRGEKFSLRFGDETRRFMAKKAIKDAIRDAGF